MNHLQMKNILLVEPYNRVRFKVRGWKGSWNPYSV